MDGGDPNFISLVEVEALSLPQLTLDAWVQQTSFNDYKNSNRIVFSTSSRPLNEIEVVPTLAAGGSGRRLLRGSGLRATITPCHSVTCRKA